MLMPGWILFSPFSRLMIFFLMDHSRFTLAWALHILTHTASCGQVTENMLASGSRIIVALHIVYRLFRTVLRMIWVLLWFYFRAYFEVLLYLWVISHVICISHESIWTSGEPNQRVPLNPMEPQPRDSEDTLKMNLRTRSSGIDGILNHIELRTSRISEPEITLETKSLLNYSLNLWVVDVGTLLPGNQEMRVLYKS